MEIQSGFCQGASSAVQKASGPGTLKASIGNFQHLLPSWQVGSLGLSDVVLYSNISVTTRKMKHTHRH